MHRLPISRKTFTLFAVDLLLITVAFLVFIWIKPASIRIYLPLYIKPFALFVSVWFGISIIFKKYAYKGKESLGDFLKPAFISNIITAGIITILIYGFNRFSYSRMIVFGTMGLSALLELILFAQYYYYRKLNRSSEKNEAILSYISQMEALAADADSVQLPEPEYTDQFPVFTLNSYKKQIVEETSEQTYSFLTRHVDEYTHRTLVLATTTQFNVNAVPTQVSNVLVNLKPINDIKRINKFLEAVNSKLPVGGLFIDCVIANEIRRDKILKFFPWGINYFFYFFYYCFKRVLPKLSLVNKVYFFITNGYDRSISKAETFGRLYSCGYEVIHDEKIDDKLYFIARKIGDPVFDANPTYGPLVSLKRMGKNGKTIHVFKFRTMHAYSEYIQEYVFEKNNLKSGGKLKDDFRISTVGRFMRRFWLDELPMLLNLLLGDLKLVGVRPLSQHYFSLYSKELQEKRIKYRPGLIPPFYADLPETLDEIMESEMHYLEAYEKNPVSTDFRYFWKAIYNIIIKRKRSG